LICPELRSIRIAVKARSAAAQRPLVVDRSLSEMYPTADANVASQPLNASEAEYPRYACELAGAGCTAIITNTPHNTWEACAIVKNPIAVVEGQRVCRGAVQVDLRR
jgi:hypothetical protein